MTETDIRRIVRETVRETLTTLGLDASAPDSVLDLQRDFAFLRRTRLGGEELARKTRLAVMGMALSGLAYLAWEGLRAALRFKAGS